MRLFSSDNQRLPSPRIGVVLACALCVVALASSGCVERRLTIRSNPPGAAVYVDNYQIGTTPCSTDYIYYGTRRIRVVKDGYQTLTVDHYLPTPWYEYPVIDFVSENVVPGEIRDERTINLTLVPQQIVPTQQLLGRAENLRGASRQEAFIPPELRGVPSNTCAPEFVPQVNLLPPPGADYFRP
jgi:hypothetical protein